MCIQVFHNGLTCFMKSGVNPIVLEEIFHKPILLRHNPNISLQKPIDRSGTSKLAPIQILSFQGLMLSINSDKQTYNIVFLKYRCINSGCTTSLALLVYIEKNRQMYILQWCSPNSNCSISKIRLIASDL